MNMTLHTPVSKAPSAVLVYGAGSMGRRTARALRERGVQVHAVLDRQARPGQQFDGIPVLPPSEWLTLPRSTAHALPVVIALHNPVHPVAQIQTELQNLGLVAYTPIDVCCWFPDALPNSYWLADPSIYVQYRAELDALEGLLADDASRTVLHGIVALRAEGRYAALTEPEPSQYYPASLPRWPKQLKLIDCGAYDGDTLLAARAQGYDIESALCFEPDPQNFRKLADTARKDAIPAICLPCAVGREATMLRFAAEGAESSHLHPEGEVQVQAIGLDESFPFFEPNLIKMDIEGAEIDALEGASKLIQTCKPNLAIAIYHHFSHLWEIPLLLHKWLPGYHFYLRAHTHNSFEIVLYVQRPH